MGTLEAWRAADEDAVSRNSVGYFHLRQQHKAYSDKLGKSVTILQCYVAHIYSAPGPGSFTAAEASGSRKLNLQVLPR